MLVSADRCAPGREIIGVPASFMNFVNVRGPLDENEVFDILRLAIG